MKIRQRLGGFWGSGPSISRTPSTNIWPKSTTIHPMLGPGTQGESVNFDFHDDGKSWKFAGRQGTFARFSYSTDRGPLPWEADYKAPPAK